MSKCKRAPVFYLKNNDLSKYALSCGWVQGIKNVQLYMENQCFHIVATISLTQDKFIRVSTHKLGLARKAYRLLLAGKEVQKHPEMSIYGQLWATSHM